jgi:hypothetical protein
MVHKIVTQDFDMRTVCAKMVPKNWNDDQKAHRIEVLAEILERLRTDPYFLNQVITGDEG